MATRALTRVASRRSLDDVSAIKGLERGRDWRKVFISQDAEAIWQQLSVLVRSSSPDNASRYQQMTQELFLNLLATDRISFYVKSRYTDSEITADLLSLLSG